MRWIPVKGGRGPLHVRSDFIREIDVLSDGEMVVRYDDAPYGEQVGRVSDEKAVEFLKQEAERGHVKDRAAQEEEVSEGSWRDE